MPSNAEAPISKSSLNKQIKTENLPSAAKGKVRIENETSCIKCGICSSEEGKSIRGYIDSCEHYFCFICITEWAKVESRCPLCKRRFSAISGQLEDGAFSTQRIVDVPVRDQVFRHFGNFTTGNQDSYAEIQCNVCHNNSNESLLLLCDLCDSASHAYCVGLGDTVPENDWICRDCTLLMYENAEDEKDLDSDGLSAIDPNSRNQNRRQNHQNVPSAEAPVSIFDIVKELRSYNVKRSSWNRSSPPSTHFRDDGISIAAANVEHNFQEECERDSRSHIAARTVQSCRNVDSRIRALRENWDKIRQGSLTFSSFSIRKPAGRGEALCGTTSELDSSSGLNRRPHPRSSSSNIIPDQATQDIRKAWKMMNAATAIEKKECNSNVPSSSNGSKRPLSDMRTPNEPASVRSMLLSSCHGGDVDQDRKKIKKGYQDFAAEKLNDKRKYHMFQKEKPCTVPNLQRYPATYSIESSKLSTSKTVQYLVQDKIDHKHRDRPVAEIHSPAKQNAQVSSSCNHKEVTNVEKHYVDGKAKIDSDAKSEIQSLVKLNLKHLSTNKKLDTKAFKEVARHATHSILAACGIGPPKPWARPFPSPVCSHADKVEQVRRSILKPTCCRECFSVFVKDVVSTIMLEKAS